MHTRERRSALLAALKEKKKVTVAELASAFDVTTMTIRRDLKRLADENIVTLVHGGAIYNEGGTTLASVGVRALLNQQGKSQLGRYCASLVQEGNAIYLDSGSTCMSIAAALAGRRNIAVLTNSLAVMNILAGSTGLQLFSMGGIFDHGTNGFFATSPAAPSAASASTSPFSASVLFRLKAASCPRRPATKPSRRPYLKPPARKSSSSTIPKSAMNPSCASLTFEKSIHSSPINRPIGIFSPAPAVRALPSSRYKHKKQGD